MSEVIIDKKIEIVPNTINVDVLENEDLSLSVKKKEFKIVGDDVFISRSFDETPSWVSDIIQLGIDIKYNQKIDSINNLTTSLNNLIDELQIAKNTYTNSIISSSDIDLRINNAIETLNSNLSGVDSSIIADLFTKVSSQEATAISLDVLQTSIDSGNISSLVTEIRNSFSDGDESNANDIVILNSKINDPDTGLEASASAVTEIGTYVGIDEAGANYDTSLSAYLKATDGTIGGADSKVANSVYIENGIPKSKWQYGSTINIGGVNYTSSFGLKTTGSESEFWIDAQKLKFTNSANTGQVSPFVIDTTGAVPNITFNGIINFESTNSNGTTKLDGDNISTGSLTAEQIAAYSVSADKLLAGVNNSTVWKGGGLVSQNFNGNVYGNIGSPTQGFRLSSDASGTTSDPNIYGAYIKGGTLEGSFIDASSLRVKAEGYPNNFGRITYFQTGGNIYMPGYSSGFLSGRVCSRYNSFVKLEGWYRAATNNLTAYLQYRNSGGGWNTLISKTAQQYGFQEYFYIYFAELMPLLLLNENGYGEFRIIGSVGGNASAVLISVYNN
jgi:hypothetical protein